MSFMITVHWRYLKAHPVSFVRDKLRILNVVKAADLNNLKDGAFYKSRRVGIGSAKTLHRRRCLLYHLKMKLVSQT